ncbi:AAA family ATPase [Rapidithrix thailandica]|uniref:AAA family ATPase n=1 Tax=Rapidithrix thailandica TaxID=413964 RepID=A0AAW9RQB3_9BACT
MDKGIFFPEVRLSTLSLTNFRGFPNLELNFDNNLTVLIGNNGSGKSTILDAIAGFLHFFVEQTFLTKQQEFSPLFKSTDVKNDQQDTYGKIRLNTIFEFIEQSTLSEIDKVIEMLNQHDYTGKKAKLVFDGEEKSWWVSIDEDLENLIVADIALKLNNHEFQIAKYQNHQWELDLNIEDLKIQNDNIWNNVDYTGKNLSIDFQFSKKRKPEFTTVQKSSELNKEEEVFFEDIKASLEVQSDRNWPLPLFAYYGAASINMETNYVADFSFSPTSAYFNTLTPSRFSLNTFFNWFENKQKIGNEKIKNETLKILNSEGSSKGKANSIESLYKNPGSAFQIEEIERLTLVKNAILEMMNDEEATYSNLRVEYNEGIPELKIDKQQNGHESELNINQLSSGERNLLAIVGDIAIRLIQLNPKIENPLKMGQGIVLIDEIDLHLHPLWQRKVIPKLRSIFPEIQFVVTTHSPFVVQSIESHQRFILEESGIRILNREDDLSYEAIMRDYFEDDKLFDNETELLLEKLYDFKTKILKKEIPIQDRRFLSLLKDFSEKSEDVKGLVARELRYIKSQLQ